MTIREAIKNIKMILDDINSDEDAICYVTNNNKEELELSIEALKRQIPKEPKTVVKFGCTTNECQVCGNFVHDDQNFCQDCGTELDWKGV